MMLPLILVFLFAFLLDFLLGDPHTKWHPVALTGRFASVMETLCRKVSDGICAGAAGCSDDEEENEPREEIIIFPIITGYPRGIN